ncbi:hypothetical protein EC957_005851 [Mortierella hygrophila]|uniref:Crinkler effector protein N-terminal domain-containing protein n=1 Tax=Mortierella hygrophila TaxID=979708 RepID=A0A9P6EZN1_9FUNG|nr:hypothetical protein EC957_005851 [Mortierella hygrophila]
MDKNLVTCLVDGQLNAFSVEMDPIKTVYDLKKLIKTENPDKFIGKVSIKDDDDDDLPIMLDSVPEPEKEKLRVTSKLSDVFKETPPKKTIHIIVQRPQDAIEDAGLAKIAMVDGESDLSRLDSKEKILLLNYIGQNVNRADTFRSLPTTAQELRRAIIEDMDELSAPPGIKLPVVGTNENDSYDSLSNAARELKGKIKAKDILSAPPGTELPIVGTKDLYVREAYKDLYDTILGTFDNNPALTMDGKKHVVVTGTSGIGKSAFLVYFTIRLLAESDDSNPPIIIFHTEQSTECYVFGGRSIVRYGNMNDFEVFLNLPDTWYFADSSPYPVLNRAKTVISYSTKTLFSDAPQYKDVEKEVIWYYYMAPWHIDEMKKCWDSVASYKVAPLDAMEELYSKVGGVPRYVLEKPMKELNRRPSDLDGAMSKALDRLEQALKTVDSSMTLQQQLFLQGKDALDSSDSLIHHWPMNNHCTDRLEWASAYVVEKLTGSLTRDAWDDRLRYFVRSYVLRAFREGGHTFELKDLETGQCARLEIPRNPKIEHFDTITQATPGTLFIPKICNHAYVDLLLAPRDMFQITVSKTHPIKGLPLKNLIICLRKASWIPSDDPRLIFVVPSQVYADFKKQEYLNSDGKVYINVPQELQQLKQYALKIDMESAVAGKSPGLQVPLL